MATEADQVRALQNAILERARELSASCDFAHHRDAVLAIEVAEGECRHLRIVGPGWLIFGPMGNYYQRADAVYTFDE